jgi:hypothetical protein
MYWMAPSQAGATLDLAGAEALHIKQPAVAERLELDADASDQSAQLALLGQASSSRARSRP